MKSSVFKLLTIMLLLIVVVPIFGCGEKKENLDYLGLVTVESKKEFDETFIFLQEILKANPAITIFAIVDHSANADGVGLSLRPTKLIIFGNPILGTPLMQNSQTMGIDLPQKFLIYEDEKGNVFVDYNDPAYLAGRHGIKNSDEIINKIAGALQKLSKGVAAP